MKTKIFVIDHNQVLADIKNEFEVVPFDQAERVVLWNDVTPIERGIVSLAKSRHIPTTVVQHGRRGTSRYYPPFNEKIMADKLLVWGEADRQALIDAGQDPKKIVVTGTTVLDHIVPRKEHVGINIVFCPEHWDRPVEENTKVRDELRKLKGVKIITKLIEGHDEKQFDNPTKSNRADSNHLDICADTLSTADVVVGISESTFELMAQAMDIPVIIVEDWEPKAFGGDMRYTQGYRRPISPASTRTTLDKLNENCYNTLNNLTALKKERKEIVVAEGGLGLPAKTNICNAIQRG